MLKKLVIICGIVVALFAINNNANNLCPVIQNPQETDIIQILYVVNTTGEWTEIAKFNERELLNYLSTQFERKTYSKFNDAYSFSDFEIIIRIHDYQSNTVKEILLGNAQNYSYSGRNTFKYQIVDAQTVLATVKELLGLERAS